MSVLTYIDLLGIQKFVFSSSRLADVLAGSLVIQQATGDFLDKAREGTGEILLNGGGNALLRFDTMDEAKTFAGKYTRRLFEEAPGLDASLVHEEIDPSGSVIKAFQQALAHTFHRKASRRALLPLVGIGVTEACRETGLPATAFDKEDNPISRVVHQRHSLEIQEKAQNQWSPFIEAANIQFHENYDNHYVNLKFPKDLDEMGRTWNEQSLMGVVHVDVNDMGQKMRLVMDKIQDRPDDEAIAILREISETINQMAQSAFAKCVYRVVDAIEYNSDKYGSEYIIRSKVGNFKFTLNDWDDDLEGQVLKLPLRPILLGGDDLTFVCDARIALDLAETALREIETTEIPEIGRFTASAGIAIVGVHVPFSRAYERAEHLCGNAKSWRHSENIKGSAIDWHIETTQSIGDITDIRKRIYKPIPTSGNFQKFRLTLRPYELGTKDGSSQLDFDVGTWMWLSRKLLTSEQGLQGEKWLGRRTKIYELETAVRAGKETVRNTFDTWKRLDTGLTLPDLKDGYLDNRTPVIDATELVDLYYRLG